MGVGGLGERKNQRKPLRILQVLDTLSGADVVRGPFADIPTKGLCIHRY